MPPERQRIVPTQYDVATTGRVTAITHKCVFRNMRTSLHAGRVRGEAYYGM